MLCRITRSVLASSFCSTLLTRAPYESAPLAANAVHTSACRRDETNKKKAPTFVVPHFFENVEHKRKDTYLDILRQYKKDNTIKRGHVEFIEVALKYMDDFGVNRDPAVYKALLDVLPKGKFIPRNYFQSIFMHYPKQQFVAVKLLCKMEHNCVMPDAEMQDMLLNIFGEQGLPLKKFWRMLYWMPKFANLNPWPCPRPAPKDPRVLARLAINKISSVDVLAKVTEFETRHVEESLEDTWIVSVMSRLQQDLLRTQPLDKPIYVEGPYIVWVADQCIDYFVLRGETRRLKEEVYEDIDDVSDIRIPFWDKKKIRHTPTIHEQHDGTYFAMCATGTSTKDSLVSWIRCLQKENPTLNAIPVMFKIASAMKEQQRIESSEGKDEIELRS